MKIFRLLAVSAIMALALSFAACSEDTFEGLESSDAELVLEEDARVSVFSVADRHFDLDGIGDLTANLSSGPGTFYSFTAEVTRAGASYRCRMRIPDGSSLPDGSYILTFSDGAGRAVPGALHAEVEGEKITGTRAVRQVFSLRQGDGTKDNPYIIASQRDFVTFLDDLRSMPEVAGRDIYFKQTADIQLMDQSSSEPGRGYWGFAFAGHYDGGRHSLTGMYYHGAESESADTGIGLFPVLMDGADIKNLTITDGNMSGVFKDAGFLAGSTCGSVMVENVTVHGAISSQGSNIGGLIGRQVQGTLTLNNIKLRATVEGRSNVGGLIGMVDGGRITVDGVSTPDMHFYVQGYENTGGIAGYATGSVLKIFRAALSHPVSSEDSDVRTVKTSGGEGTGGVVGMISSPSTGPVLSDVVVACPVGGDGNRVGGLIGKFVAQDQTLYMYDCGFTSIAGGLDDVGGFIGYTKITGHVTSVIGDVASDCYIVADGAAAAVTGRNCVGGVFGYIEGFLYPGGKHGIRVAVNVKSSEDCAGGVAGKCYNINFDADDFDLTSAIMRVEGRNNVGGFCGMLEKGSLNGSDRFDYQAQADGNVWIPKPSERHPVFRGIVNGYSNVGGLIGFAKTVTVSRIAVECGVKGTGGTAIGGVIGALNAYGGTNLIEDVTSGGDVGSSGAPYTGGIVGYLRTGMGFRMQDCINYGKIQGGTDTGGCVGKFVLDNASGSGRCAVRYCVNTGEVCGHTRVGGVVGMMDVTVSLVYDYLNTEVVQCANFGSVTASEGTDEWMGTGGIIGYGHHGILVENCMNAGEVYAEGEQHGVGGIAGALGRDPASFYSDYNNVNVHKCVNRGSIRVPDKKGTVGGILGVMEEGDMSYLDDCWNKGEILYDHNEDNGGIVGYVDHLTHIYRCVNYGKVSYGNATIGTHKDGSQFSHGSLYFIEGTGKDWPKATSVPENDKYSKSRYGGLDFDHVWTIGSYGPELRDNYFQNATY